MSTHVIQEIAAGKAHMQHLPAPFIKELQAQMLEHATQGRTERALEYAQALLLTSPESAQSWLLVGGMYRELGMASLSLKCVEQAHTHDSSNRAVRLSRGELWVELGRHKKGLNEIRDVFLEGYDPKKKPVDQDLTTLRAGAIIEAVERLATSLAQER